MGDQLIGAFQNPGLLTGIPLALLGALFMSFGAQYQHRGVTKVEKLSGAAAAGGLTGGQLWRLLRRPSWVVGTVMLGLAILCQLGALSYAPLIVVQPLGAVALVITAVLNARISKVKLGGGAIRAIAFCVGGVALFVTVAALTAVDPRVTDEHLITILIVLAIVGVLLGGAWLVLRQRVAALALDLLGPDGLRRHRTPGAPADGSFERLYRAAPLMRFGAGANEVLRDVVAQRGHGMPSYGRSRR